MCSALKRLLRGNRNTYFFAGRAIRIALPERIISSWDWSSFVTKKRLSQSRQTYLKLKTSFRLLLLMAFTHFCIFKSVSAAKAEFPSSKTNLRNQLHFRRREKEFQHFPFVSTYTSECDLWPFSSIIVQRPPNSSLEMAQV